MNATDEDAKSAGLDEPGVPSLLAWLASLATIALIAATLFLPRGGNSYLRGAGVLVLLMGAVFAFIPFLQLRKQGRAASGKTYMETEAVADHGLYAITRHPQYLGYMLLACGFALLSQHWIALLLAGFGVTLFYCQAVREERYCVDRLGEPYKRYQRRVPRFNVVLGIARLLRRS